MGSAQQDLRMVKSETMTSTIMSNINEPRHAIMCLREIYYVIIPTQCFYCFFGYFDWSVGNIKLFLHFDKNPCVGIFDNCLDFTVLH